MFELIGAVDLTRWRCGVEIEREFATARVHGRSLTTAEIPQVLSALAETGFLRMRLAGGVLWYRHEPPPGALLREHSGTSPDIPALLGRH